jgi:hypothetical protein
MSPDRQSERTPDDAGLDEAPVDKFLRLAAASENLLRTKPGEVVGAYVTLNVGGITAADREESGQADD